MLKDENPSKIRVVSHSAIGSYQNQYCNTQIFFRYDFNFKNAVGPIEIHVYIYFFDSACERS